MPPQSIFFHFVLMFDNLNAMQAVDHPYLVEYSRAKMEKKGETVDTRSDGNCSICNDPEEDTVVSCIEISTLQLCSPIPLLKISLLPSCTDYALHLLLSSVIDLFDILLSKISLLPLAISHSRHYYLLVTIYS